VDVRGGGFLHAYPQTSQWNGSSSVNTSGVNQQMGNVLIVPIGAGGISVYHGGVGSGYILDVVGYIK
jgi:hypothetical protein